MKYILKKKKKGKIKAILIMLLLFVGTLFACSKTCGKVKAVETQNTIPDNISIDLEDIYTISSSENYIIQYSVSRTEYINHLETPYKIISISDINVFLIFNGNNIVDVLFKDDNSNLLFQTAIDINHLEYHFIFTIYFIIDNSYNITFYCYDKLNDRVITLYNHSINTYYLRLLNNSVMNAYYNAQYYNNSISVSNIIINFPNVNGVYNNMYRYYEMYYNIGYSSGKSDGQALGYSEGYTDGTTDGYNEGYTDGTTDGQMSGKIQGATQKQYDIFNDTFNNLSVDNNNYYKEIIQNNNYYQLFIPLNDFKDRTTQYDFIKISFYYNINTSPVIQKNLNKFLYYTPNITNNKGCIYINGGAPLIKYYDTSINYDNKYLWLCFYLDNNDIKYFYSVTDKANLMTKEGFINFDTINNIISNYNNGINSSGKLLTITSDYACYISKKNNFQVRYNEYTNNYTFKTLSALPLGLNSSVGNAYNNGYNVGLSESVETSGFTNFFVGIFTALGGLLSLQIFPGITIGGIVAIPLAIGLIWFIIKMARGGGGN